MSGMVMTNIISISRVSVRLRPTIVVVMTVVLLDPLDPEATD